MVAHLDTIQLPKQPYPNKEKANKNESDSHDIDTACMREPHRIEALRCKVISRSDVSRSHKINPLYA